MARARKLCSSQLHDLTRSQQYGVFPYALQTRGLDASVEESNINARFRWLSNNSEDRRGENCPIRISAAVGYRFFI